MTSKQRAYLRGLASTQSCAFQVGKSSLTPELTAAIGEALEKNELVKINVLKNCADDPGEISQMVAERTRSHLQPHPHRTPDAGRVGQRGGRTG